MGMIEEALWKFQKEIVDNLNACRAGELTLEAIAGLVRNGCMELGCRVIEAIVTSLSEAYFADRNRIRTDIAAKDRTRRKAVLTSMGMVYLPNDVYQNRKAADGERKYFRPVMEALGIAAHQQISGNCPVP